jgi:nicotinate-nucleotide pyrophosphorylase (carboxylating)
MFGLTIDQIIENALLEDIGDGDHTSLSTVPKEAMGKAKLLVKQDGILAGVDIAEKVFKKVDPEVKMEVLIKDGTPVKKGDIAFYVEGRSVSLLTGERLALNFMQRMSGIATQTNLIVEKLKGTTTKVLDTRKTTPNLRVLEKYAVTAGGGHNHRIGLYDMIMIKDNHVDFAGGVRKAIEAVQSYLKEKGKDLKIEVEVRSFEELNEAIETGGIHRIMLDNFSPEKLKEALVIIDSRYETEASGGITLETIRDYAETGVDFISVGALTHQIKSLDLSLKAV